MKLQYTPFDGANLTAKYLLEIGAVTFRADDPFVYTSGRRSPIYVDVRKVLGTCRLRSEINRMSYNRIFEVVGAGNFQYVAGGETAGIPFATLIADRMDKPMCYIRKAPKGFGHNSQIECLSDDQLALGKKIILIEDMCSDGGSKKVFVDAIRRSGNVITDVFVIFSYGCFGAASSLINEGVRLISLTDGLTLLDVADDLDWSTKPIRDEIRRFLAAPDAWGSSTPSDQ